MTQRVASRPERASDAQASTRELLRGIAMNAVLALALTVGAGLLSYAVVSLLIT